MISIGVIAEDDSDVDVIREVISKYINEDSYCLRRHCGKGCGRILGKCRGWAENLRRQGCRFLIVVRDLDRKDQAKLRSDIESILSTKIIDEFAVVIPIQEIEAWLLADHDAIRRTFGIKVSVSKISNPELVLDPKARLGEIVYLRSGKKRRYVNTVHNTILARNATIGAFSRCKSYLPLDAFIKDRILKKQG